MTDKEIQEAVELSNRVLEVSEGLLRAEEIAAIKQLQSLVQSYLALGELNEEMFEKLLLDFQPKPDGDIPIGGAIKQLAKELRRTAKLWVVKRLGGIEDLIKEFLPIYFMKRYDGIEKEIAQAIKHHFLGMEKGEENGRKL